MRRFIPPLVILVVVLALAAYFGPGLYRAWLFRRDCGQLLLDTRAGRLQAVIHAIEQQQQLRVGALLTQHVPVDYYTDIVSLRRTSYEEPEPGLIWCIVTLRLQQGDGIGLYQGRLRWVFKGRRWWWDFEGSYGAQFSTSGEPEWIKLSDLVDYAEQL